MKVKMSNCFIDTDELKFKCVICGSEWELESTCEGVICCNCNTYFLYPNCILEDAKTLIGRVFSSRQVNDIKRKDNKFISMARSAVLDLYFFERFIRDMRSYLLMISKESENAL